LRGGAIYGISNHSAAVSEKFNSGGKEKREGTEKEEGKKPTS